MEMVTHQLQVRCRPVKVRRSETDVLPLSHPTNQLYRLLPEQSQRGIVNEQLITTAQPMGDSD